MESWRKGEAEIAAREHARVATCGREQRASWFVIQREGNASAFNGYRWQSVGVLAMRVRRLRPAVAHQSGVREDAARQHLTACPSRPVLPELDAAGMPSRGIHQGTEKGL